MKASAFVFRYRMILQIILFALGFFAPWNYWLHLDSIRTWQYLAALPSRAGLLSFVAATNAVLIFGILCTLISALLRTWGSAYLGSAIVTDSAMHAHQVLAAGPYRYVRNPLYLGSFIHSLALLLLMPPTGAVFTLITTTIVRVMLVTGEEQFLRQQQGEAYQAYCAKVPRILPALTPRVPASSQQPHWPQAFFGEIYVWGVFLTFAVLGWRYSAPLLLQGVIVSLGVSLIVRALMPRGESAQAAV
jgi:protein-S-isoprenylcysteine O-methyltransferase Ste14